MKAEFHFDYRTILANQAQPVHLAIRFTANKLGQARPQPAAFCLVLDRSGSMTGEPINQAKAAASLSVRNLRSEDLFALVIFDTQAQTLVPLQPPSRREELAAAIDAIEVRDSTNLTGGWTLGRDELRKAPSGTLRRLLLLSDGQLNTGITDPVAVQQIVAQGLEADGVRTSCLGFGDNYDEHLLVELARATNGTFYDAAKPESLPPIFASELDGLQQIAVQNLRLRLKRLDFCEGLTQLGDYPAITLPDGRQEIAVGDLVSEEERIACLALEVLPLPMVSGVPVASLEGEELLEVELAFDEITSDSMASRTVTQTLRIQATQDPAQVRLNGEVAGWVATQRAGRTIRAVTEHMSHGNTEDAGKLLDQALAQLRAYSGDDSKIAEALRALMAVKEQWTAGMTARELKTAQFDSSKMRRLSSRNRLEYIQRWQAEVERMQRSSSPSPSPKPSSTDEPPAESPR